MNPSLVIETITPAAATEMLKLNTANRPLRKARVNLYASEMAAGRWLLTGEPIILNGQSLINGQHRLAACVKADVPFVTAVMRDADIEIYKVIDTGLARTAGDMLNHEGIPGYNIVAAAAKLVLTYNAGMMQDNFGAALAASRPLILAEVQEHREAYSTAGVVARRCRQEGYNPSAFAAFAVLLGRIVGEDAAWEWINGAVEGAGLELGDPRLAMRRWTVSVKPSTQALFHLSAWIRARNAYARNASLTVIKTWFTGTPYPRLVEAEGQ